MSEQPRLLRGRVVIREDMKADVDQYTHIVVPDVWTCDDKDAIARARSWHRGTVLAMGPPALTKRGVEVPFGFGVGDTVLFHFEHHERAATRPWVDGQDAVWCPQQCVDAVVTT